jgi:hypothetical protein
MLRQFLYPVFGMFVFGGYGFMETLPTDSTVRKGSKFAEKSQLEGKGYRAAPISWNNTFTVPRMRPRTPPRSYSPSAGRGSSYSPRRSSYGGSSWK